jgi:hypothetical protein
MSESPELSDLIFERNAMTPRGRSLHMQPAFWKAGADCADVGQARQAKADFFHRFNRVLWFFCNKRVCLSPASGIYASKRRRIGQTATKPKMGIFL